VNLFPPFSRSRFTVLKAVGSAEEAEVAAGRHFGCPTDVWLPGIDGLEALSRLQASAAPVVVI